MVYITNEGDRLHERPIIKANEEKEKVLTTINEQKKRRNSLSKSVFKSILDKEKAKSLIIEINDHFLQSKEEWKEYFTSLDNGIGLKIQDHMPIYYCIKIGNYLENNC